MYEINPGHNLHKKLKMGAIYSNPDLEGFRRSTDPYLIFADEIFLF